MGVERDPARNFMMLSQLVLKLEFYLKRIRDSFFFKSNLFERDLYF